VQGGTKPRTGADAFALPQKDKGDDAHEGGDAAQEAAGAGDTQAVKEGRRGEREDGGEEGARARGGCVGGGGKYFVGVGEVVSIYSSQRQGLEKGEGEGHTTKPERCT
jgi:hypothetical protein